MGEMISVIVPVYNVAAYLGECIDSILAQTYRELEIILVDDGSTDGSGEICDEYAAKDDRVRVIHQENRGVSAARNNGFEAAHGAFIGFVDADDWIDPNMYKALVEAIGDADLVCCGYMEYPMGTLEFSVPRGVKPAAPCGVEEALIHIYERNGYYVTLWNKLFRRQSLMRNGRFLMMDTSLYTGEDELWLMEVVTGCDKIAFVPEPLYHWRPRAESVTRQSRLTERLMSLLDAKKKVFSLLPKSDRLQSLVNANTCNILFNMKVKAYCSKDKDKFERTCAFMKPMKEDWIKTTDWTWLRKAKVCLLETEMRFRMPVRLVEFTDNWKRYGYKK